MIWKNDAIVRPQKNLEGYVTKEKVIADVINNNPRLDQTNGASQFAFSSPSLIG